MALDATGRSLNFGRALLVMAVIMLVAVVAVIVAVVVAVVVIVVVVVVVVVVVAVVVVVDGAKTATRARRAHVAVDQGSQIFRHPRRVRAAHTSRCTVHTEENYRKKTLRNGQPPGPKPASRSVHSISLSWAAPHHVMVFGFGM